MKIKEVIEKTGLTDRAIRLYIENGLVSPSCSENYAGRKSIEFSEGDVESLKNIATLRKAGFSIAEIKLLKLGDVHCRKTLEEFIEKTTQRIESDKAVLEKLEAVVTYEELTMETICESLNAVTEAKSVPAEDTTMTKAERIWHFISRTVSVVGFVYFALAVALQAFEFFSLHPMRYPVFEAPFYVKWALMLYILGVSLLLFYNQKLPKLSLSLKAKQNGLSVNLNKLITVVLCIILIPVCFFSYLYNLGTLFTPAMHSETADLKNYLKIDKRIDKFADEIYEFFPKEIETVEKDIEIFGKKLFSYKDYSGDYKYFYRYRLVVDNDKDLTVVLCRSLLPREFKEEVEKYSEMRPTGCENITIKQQRGWTLIYYCDAGESPNDYYGEYMYKIFAYNDYGQVRYIMEYNAGSPVGYYTIPHHINMHW